MSTTPAGADESRSEAVGASLKATPDGPSLGEELELWHGRTSWRNHARTWLLWAVVVVLLLWAWLHFRSQVEGAWLGKTVFLLILASGLGLFVPTAWQVYGTRYRLTNQRLFVGRGILGKTTDQTELIRVDDIRVHQTLLNRIFGVGDIELISTDPSEPSTRLVGVSGPAEIAEHVREHMRSLRMKRSLFVEHL